MRLMPIGSYIEGNSLLHRMDAFIKLLSTFILLTAVIFTDSFIGYIILIGMMIAIVRLSKIGFENALSGVKHLWLFFIIVFLMNAVFFESVHSLWDWWFFQFSLDGVVQGINVVLRVMLAMVLGNILVSVTSPLDITGAIESLIFPLKYIGVPIQDVAMILGIAIQFIPTFIEETDMIKKAQTARGARFESKKISEKAQSVIPLVVPIFLSAFRRADELSVAMEARGYHRTKRKIRYRRRKICVLDIIALLMCILVLVAEIMI